MIETIVANLSKVGYGVGLFAIAYIANMLLGSWKNIKLDGAKFEWRLWVASAVKFVVLGIGLAMLSVAVTLVPYYAAYTGMSIGEDTLDAISTVVICGAFLVASTKYLTDAISKIKAILE